MNLGGAVAAAVMFGLAGLIMLALGNWLAGVFFLLAAVGMGYAVWRFGGRGKP